MTALRRIAYLCALIFSVAVAHSQVATGTYAYGTFDNKGFDTINVGSLNVHFSIPVINKSGRGIPFYYNLSYDSSVWYPTGVSGAQTWTPVQNFGWTGDTEIAVGYVSYVQNVSTRGACTTVRNSQFVYHDTFGTSHSFNGAATEVIPSGNGTCSSESYPGSGLTAVANDNSGYTINVTGISTVSLTSASGKQISPPIQEGTGSATYTDTNGNQISVNSTGKFTDTTGNVVLTVTGNAPSAHTFTYTDTSGNSQSVSMNYTTYTVQTKFGCSIGEYGPTSTSLVSSISLPGGSGTYQFTYEPTPGVPGSVTGRIASVTLPTGGVITYTYSGGSNGIVCSDGSTAALSRAITASNGSAASTWSYARTTSGATSTTAVVDGLTNQSTYDFVLGALPPGQTNGVSADYYETSRVINQTVNGVNTALLSRATCYNTAVQPCTTTALTLPITQIDTYETLNGIQQHGSEAKFNTYGLQTDKYDYDFGGASSRGSLLRHEVWTYPSTGIASLLSSDEVYDGSGNLAAHTNYGYDNLPVTSSSGVPQHVAVSGQRGNLTGMTQYSSSGETLASSFTYEDTGSVLTSTTPNGTANYSYDSTFVYATGLTPPTPSSGVSLPTSLGYDTSHTGLPTSSTDPNTAQTGYKYADPLLRMTEIDNPDGGKTSVFYRSTVQTGIESYQNASTYADTEVQQDGYQRSSRVAVANGQSSNPWYQSDTCYDGNGNVTFTSYAYQGNEWNTAKVCSGAGDSYAYDALGRITKVTHADGTAINYTYSGRAVQSGDENGVTRISQTDGLGRLTAVCEISSSTLQGAAPTACGLDISGTGFSTTYAYNLANHTTTTTQGAQTRVFQTDWLGRPTLIQQPESGQTTYSYAYNSTGLAVTRQRPAANQSSSTTLTTTTTQYDTLGRAISISYSDGVTPTTYYNYDTNPYQSWSAETTTNLKGNLAIASRFSGNTLITSTLFSYDAMGRVLNLWQCAPSICGTVNQASRPIAFNYDWTGNKTLVDDEVTGGLTYAYSPAGEVTSISPQLVSNVVNGPSGPISYTLGNGLSAARSYDTLSRPNGLWVCPGPPSINCASRVYSYGVQFRGTQVQSFNDTAMYATFSAGYDEFNRLKSYTIDSQGGWTQNYAYTYDRYGNRWAQTITSGPSGPQPSVSFNSANNQVNSGGFAYDAAGNMTNDGTYSYTYDADGNVISVNNGETAKYTYDALNHRVQTQNSNGATEFIYDSSGKVISSWPVPGPYNNEGHIYWNGLQIAFRAYNGQTYFDHRDFIGTARMRTNSSGGIDATHTSLPFGDAFTSYPESPASNQDTIDFADLNLDYETGNDEAQFRYYSSVQGHWLSPDPYSGSYDFTNPQSLNRYSYVLNNPLSYLDPLGLDTICFFSYAKRGGASPNFMLPPGPTCIDDGDGGGGGGGGQPGGGGGSAPSNFMNVSLTTKPCSASGAFSLDYSQPLFNGGTQTSQQHIMQRHGGSGLPGVSQYNGSFGQIQNLNSMTYLFGSQTVQGTSVVFQFSLPQAFSPFGLYSYIGTDASGQPTSTNRLITTGNCKTVVTSYPISDPVPVPYP